MKLGKSSPEGNILDRCEYVKTGCGDTVQALPKPDYPGANKVLFDNPNAWKNLFTSPGYLSTAGRWEAAKR